MSYRVKLVGVISNIRRKEIFEDSDYSHGFYKQIIHLVSRQQEYEIEFIKEKSSLLDQLKKGDEIEIEVTLLARKFNGKIYNILRAQKLKVLKSDFTENILYDGYIWRLYKNSDKESFKLVLQDVETRSRVLEFGHCLSDRSFVLIHPFYKENLIKILEEYKVLVSGNTIEYQNQSYIICKLSDIERIPVLN